jgi:hypothetical protein
MTTQGWIVAGDVSSYKGIEDGLTGGNWEGGTFTVGKGIQGAHNIAWNYKLIKSIKLDDKANGAILSALGRCECEILTGLMPGGTHKNDRILTKEIPERDYTGEIIGKETYVGGKLIKTETYPLDTTNYVPIAPGPLPVDVPIRRLDPGSLPY